MQRRQLLKAVAGAGLGAVCAPMINQGRFRLFAGSKEEYSARAVELVGRSVVIDMLSPFKLGSTTWFTNPDSFRQADFQRFKDSGINYTDHEIEMVLGGNFKRVLAQIWSV